MIKLNQTEDTGAAVCTSAHRADEDICKGGELRFIVAMFTRSTHHNRRCAPRTLLEDSNTPLSFWRLTSKHPD